jgi:transcriptional regulator with XRE-family HTH domain
MSTQKARIFDSFSEALSFVLESKGLRQNFISEKMGVNDSQVSKWINGKVTPHKSTIEKITKVLNYEFDQDYNGKWSLTLLGEQTNSKVDQKGAEYEKRPNPKQIEESITYLEQAIPYIEKKVTDPELRGILADQLLELVLSETQLVKQQLENLEHRVLLLRSVLKKVNE